jgi:transposase InsO family protein
MKDLFEIAGLSKQALCKAQKRELSMADTIGQCLSIIQKIRRRHRHMGCRSIYDASNVKPPVGRDKFIAIGMANGYRVKRRRNRLKTTRSQQLEIFPNRIEGRSLRAINKVWQSDIFYFQEQGKVYYGVTIVDVYSRRLLSLHLSTTLEAEENVKALRKAIRCRSRQNLAGCVLHSDQGTQYISEKLKSLIRHTGMLQSMCKLPQENAYAERIHETIKYYYLCDEQLEGQNLDNVARRVMRKYNYEKPHSELGKLTPVAFEKYVENLPPRSRPKLVIFKWDHQLSTKFNVANKKKKVAKKKK